MKAWWAEFAAGAYAHTLAGLGFLGAGVILKDGTNIRRLNTAATLAGFVLAGNTLLRPLVNWVNRRPITPDATEAMCIVHATCRPEDVSDGRDLLDAELDRASYPVREVETLSETDAQVELAAILVPTTAEDAELDAVAAALEASPLVLSATWSVETTS